MHTTVKKRKDVEERKDGGNKSERGEEGERAQEQSMMGRRERGRRDRCTQRKAQRLVQEMRAGLEGSQDRGHLLSPSVP